MAYWVGPRLNSASNRSPREPGAPVWGWAAILATLMVTARVDPVGSEENEADVMSRSAGAVDCAVPPPALAAVSWGAPRHTVVPGTAAVGALVAPGSVGASEGLAGSRDRARPVTSGTPRPDT